MPEYDSQSTDRRAFLIQCSGAAAVFFVPAAFAAVDSEAPEFHLHPHYRDQTLLDAALLPLDPALDVFRNEPSHDRIAAILSTWSSALLRSPHHSDVLAKDLSDSFQGSSWSPERSVSLRRASSALAVSRVSFDPQTPLGKDDFLAELQTTLSHFSELFTADFQITGIDSQLVTQVRYELAGSGPGFYREQRTGLWTLSWNTARQVTRWQAHDEVRCRSSKSFFSDISEIALGSNSSYSSQLLQGVDYWRNILDSACGIDIYGHNGVSAADLHGNGLDDIYVCQPAGLPNRLYRNLGNGVFEDITEFSGLGILENTACCLFADFSNRGRQDAVVVRAFGPLLFLNEGNGKFRLKPNAFAFGSPPQGTFTGAAAADYNRDGLLDIYFCLYSYYRGAGQYRYPTPYFAAENGPPNFLLHNNGDGTFLDVTARCGLDQNNTRYSFCCGWSDYDCDGWADLYVVNDFGRKNLYHNNGDGTFTDLAREAGVEDVGAGMSVCWLDYNNDGVEDLYVANMWTAAGERLTSDTSFQNAAPEHVRSLYRKHAMGNTLLRNSGGSFRNATPDSQTALGRWSWSSDAWDFDHDGFADIYVANGMISGSIRQDLNSFFWRQVVAKSPNAAESSTEYEQGWNAVNELIRDGYSWSGFERNVLFANNRDGTFSEISGALGLDFPEDSRSFSLADVDGDGRQELILKNRNAPQVRVLKNVLAELPPSISFRLRGTNSNSDAIGAAVTIRTTIGSQTRLLQAGSGFLSQHSKELFFGLGDSKGSVSATIRWPSGLVQQLKTLPPGHRISVTEGLEPTLKAFETPRPGESVTHSPRAQISAGETWLLVPVTAPGISPGRAQVLHFQSGPASATPRSWAVIDANDPINNEKCAIYNLLFRQLFDSHRDLPLPASFLIDESAQIVKIYQQGADPETVEHDLRRMQVTNAGRLARALPFPGVSTISVYTRNYLSLGSIFFQRGYPEPAKDYFEAALKDDPTSAEASYGLGSIYLKQQQNSVARECFDRATQLKASYPETMPNAWNNLGLISARAGDTGKAVGYFEQALRLNGRHFVALQNLASAYRQQSRWPEARQTLERALAIKPEDAEANYSLGMVFAQLDDTDKAYAYLTKALQAKPVYPEALNNLGILYLRTHRRDDAVAVFEKCIQLVPAFEQSYKNLARVYAVEGDNEKAQSVLRALEQVRK